YSILYHTIHYASTIILLTALLLFSSYPTTRSLHSFPTRRSSDLVLVQRLAVPAAGVVAEHWQRAHDPNARCVERHEDHRLAVVRGRGGIRDAEQDCDLAPLRPRPARPPLVGVDHGVGALTPAAGLDVRRVRARDPPRGHREARPDLAVQEREQPLLLLLRGAELGEDLHVARVGRGAVGCLRREQVATHELAQWRVVEVGEAGAPLLVGEEEVPQAARSRFALELLHDGWVEVRVARFLHLVLVDGLGRDDARVDEVAQLLLELERPGAELEVHKHLPSVGTLPGIRRAGGVELLT